METLEFKNYAHEFIRDMNIDPGTLRFAFQELKGGEIHIGLTSIQIKPKDLYSRSQATKKYCVTESAPTLEHLPDMNDENKRYFTLAFFQSKCTRVQMVKKLNALGMPGNLMSAYVFDRKTSPSPLVILIPHPKKERLAVKFDFQIYEAASEPIKGELCAAIAISYAKVGVNPQFN